MPTRIPLEQPRRVVIIGHGPVGYSLIDNLVENAGKPLQIKVISECRFPAYNRVLMTSFFKHRSTEQLELASREWYEENGIQVIYGQATRIDRERQEVLYEDRGIKQAIEYDELVFATGSAPFVPSIPGLSLEVAGIFVYRTITDMQKMIERAPGHHSAAVIGGGLLGLEGAKALYDLNLKVHVLEVAPHLLPAQIGQAASKIVRQKVEQLGVTVHTGVQILEVLSNDAGVSGVRIKEDGQEHILNVCMLVVSAGVRPRDELARACGLEVGERGGVKVDSHMTSTTDKRIHAVGEVASFNGGMVYGLWAPGVEQARVLSCTIGCPEKRREYKGSDLSTKLKLMGVDVASFGGDPAFWTSRLFDASPETKRLNIMSSVASDPSAGVCRRLVFQRNPSDGSFQLLGGVLIGDVEDYGELRKLARSGKKLWGTQPAELTQGSRAGSWNADDGTAFSSFMTSVVNNGVNTMAKL
jgi:nitrite reductase (NADH) large subunit